MAYPSSITTDTASAGTSTLSSPDHSDRHNVIGSAVIAIENVLGTNSGTQTLMNFMAGDFAARINSSNVLQQALQGTLNSSTIGTPTLTGGTIAAVLIGTSTIQGGTANNQVIGTPAITGGTANNQVMGTPAITGGTITSSLIKYPVVVQKATALSPSGAGTATLDLSLGNIFDITMPAGNITIATSGVTTDQCFIVTILQDGGGSRTVTWFSTIRWANSGTPTLTITGSKRDMFGFRATGTATFDGVIIGQNF